MEYETREYETPTGSVAHSISGIDANGTVWSIPLDEANADYQTYLAYLAEEKN